MFAIYQSNQLNILLSKICEIVNKKPLDSIFEKEIIVHDNRVLFEYINIFIANQIGISANFQLFHPRDFIYTLFKIILTKKK